MNTVQESKPKVRCLIIDADVNSLRELSRVVINHGSFDLVNSAKTGRSALYALKEAKVDLIFLNPALPDANGFDLMTSITDPPLVVVISDRQDYAYYAYRIDAIDYRLKPITPDILEGILERAYRRMQETAK